MGDEEVVEGTEEIIGEVIEPEEKLLKDLVPSDWENIFRNFANPNCSKPGCYGRGYTGWKSIWNEEKKETERHPVGCTRKGCAMKNFIGYQISKKRKKTLEEVEEKKRIDEEAKEKEAKDKQRSKALTTDKLSAGRLQPKKEKK